ncbi:phosphotransferase enzyme family protein [Rhizobium etli]|uniref:Aminoglycoside phosphotransferase n=1 Tax=Rhizobium etli TaxID=29449 RepID=A0A7W6VEU9_RHIET|nr:aminoglycoside phosphotransferase family protein [Rhizobium etli]MBB4481852.1 aminoglycoside phosphotransferase [Rhizobium etli]MBB4537681.1 aminoglycoside phosphotransferase [Rhizobium etli]
MKLLEGGRTGQIWRDGNSVIRPSGAWTPTVHRFLRHLRNRGFRAAPEPIAISAEGEEVVSYVAGRVCEDLRDPFVGSERMLISAARLLREFHSASEGFLESDGEIKAWMLPPQEPREIVCHADFAPYNVATVDHEAVGIIDFDTAHPAPRLWDLAYAVYRWAPLSDPANSAVAFGLEEQLRRAEIFCTAYGATVEERRRLPEMICRRLQALVDFMLASAAAGDATFVEDVATGDARLYLNDIQYIGTHQDRLLKALS